MVHGEFLGFGVWPVDLGRGQGRSDAWRVVAGGVVHFHHRVGCAHVRSRLFQGLGLKV